VPVATYLLNEKRRSVFHIEKQHGVKVLIIPNPHMDTPQYEVIRVRKDESIAEASYDMPITQAETEQAVMPKFDTNTNKRDEPALQGMSAPKPPTPKEQKVTNKPSQVVIPKTTKSNSGGFFAWLKGLFSSEEVVEQKPAPTHNREREQNNRRPRKNNQQRRQNGRNKRPNDRTDSRNTDNRNTDNRNDLRTTRDKDIKENRNKKPVRNNDNESTQTKEPKEQKVAERRQRRNKRKNVRVQATNSNTNNNTTKTTSAKNSKAAPVVTGVTEIVETIVETEVAAVIIEPVTNNTATPTNEQKVTATVIAEKVSAEKADNNEGDSTTKEMKEERSRNRRSPRHLRSHGQRRRRQENPNATPIDDVFDKAVSEDPVEVRYPHSEENTAEKTAAEKANVSEVQQDLPFVEPKNEKAKEVTIEVTTTPMENVEVKNVSIETIDSTKEEMESNETLITANDTNSITEQVDFIETNSNTTSSNAAEAESINSKIELNTTSISETINIVENSTKTNSIKAVNNDTATTSVETVVSKNTVPVENASALKTEIKTVTLSQIKGKASAPMTKPQTINNNGEIPTAAISAEDRNSLITSGRSAMVADITSQSSAKTTKATGE